MLNFTVGPVQAFECVKEIGKEDVPYFRTPEFSEVVKETEQQILTLLQAPADSKAIFFTGSGTAGMEAAVSNTLTPKDRVLIVNGGTFGHRFVELCEIYEIPFEEILLKPGEALTEEKLSQYANKGFTGFLVNIHETSTGVYYNPDLIGTFARENNLFLIVDAISSFLADPFNMESVGADVVIMGSQKALACPPGMSILALSPKAVSRVESAKVRSLYFDLKLALDNAKRGQTPFTPAVSVILQLHARLGEVIANGVDQEFERVRTLAKQFRDGIKDLPLELFSQSMSNAVTACRVQDHSAPELFETMKNKYGIWICPNGGELKQDVFRIGHIGNITPEQNQYLIECLRKELGPENN